jgi:hypothetical protein
MGVEIRSAVTFFNLFNFANFDGRLVPSATFWTDRSLRRERTGITARGRVRADANFLAGAG